MPDPEKPDIQPDFLNSLFGLDTKSKKNATSFGNQT